MKSPMAATLLAAAALIASGCAAGSDQYSINELPTTVRMTVNDQTGGGTIESIERESTKGLTYYEVEYELDGNDWMLRVDDSGEVIAREKA